MRTWTLARSLAREFRRGEAIAVHCYAGIGRSALLLACILVSLGVEAEAAWAAISRARGFDVPETAGAAGLGLPDRPRIGTPHLPPRLINPCAIWYPCCRWPG